VSSGTFPTIVALDTLSSTPSPNRKKILIANVEIPSKALQAGNDKNRLHEYALVGDIHAAEKTTSIQAAAVDFAFERLLTADEAIKLIPIHRNTLLLWARQGKIRSISVGRRVFFRASDLNRWLETPCYAGHAVLIASTERTMA
jgi:excisionase family DNA binding protein